MVVHEQSIDATESDSRTMSRFFSVLKKKDDDGNNIIAIDIGIFETFAKGKDSRKCLSSFETDRFLALLSIPPWEEEGGRKERDGQAAVMVPSFGGAVHRWCHSIYWNRKEGKEKEKIKLLTSAFFFFLKL